MKESTFSNHFIRAMKKKWPHMWELKVHGGDMQRAFIPDYLFCINGKFVAIEFKIQRDKRISFKPMQIRELSEIKNANGVALLIAYDENHGKILINERRLNWRTVKSRISWDFEFNKYENAVDLIGVMI